MAYIEQDQILVSELRAALLATAMLIAVSGLSVPGFLDEYSLVEGDHSKYIFNLNLRINAQNFTINANFEPASNSFKQACELFSIERNAGRHIMVTPKQTVNHVEENMSVCVATISVQVICNTASSEFSDCGKEAKYNVTIKILKAVSSFLLEIPLIILLANQAFRYI